MTPPLTGSERLPLAMRFVVIGTLGFIVAVCVSAVWPREAAPKVSTLTTKEATRGR